MSNLVHKHAYNVLEFVCSSKTDQTELFMKSNLYNFIQLIYDLGNIKYDDRIGKCDHHEFASDSELIETALAQLEVRSNLVSTRIYWKPRMKCLKHLLWLVCANQLENQMADQCLSDGELIDMIGNIALKDFATKFFPEVSMIGFFLIIKTYLYFGLKENSKQIFFYTIHICRNNQF